MTNDDRKFLAYLTAWAVSRINVQIYNMKPCTDFSVFPAQTPQLLQEAESILSEWPEEKSEYSSEVGMGVFQTCGPLKIPEKEMTAKELVVKVLNENFIFTPRSMDEVAYQEAVHALLAFMKKEAGL